MKLKSKNNLLLWFWRYNRENSIKARPYSICSLFWGGLFGILFFATSPAVNIYAFVESKATKKSFLETSLITKNDGFLLSALNFVLCAGYATGVVISSEIFTLPLWFHYTIGWISILVFTAVVVGIAIRITLGFAEIGRKLESKKNKQSKICAPIEWED